MGATNAELTHTQRELARDERPPRRRAAPRGRRRVPVRATENVREHYVDLAVAHRLPSETNVAQGHYGKLLVANPGSTMLR